MCYFQAHNNLIYSFKQTQNLYITHMRGDIVKYCSMCVQLDQKLLFDCFSLFRNYNSLQIRYFV
ncbi:hypothetical protein HZS_7347 [Henneguya salminicola]|nr:hypothetical protein HZS_7347 [Henneguya salminicola]